MRSLYAVGSEEELRTYQAAAQRLQPRLEAYIAVLRERFAVKELPRAIVWTSAAAATNLLSNIPVPAYTNEYRVIFCPEPDVWRHIWLKQLDGLTGPAAGEIRTYYQTSVTDDRILSILGHELAHHSEFFLDGFDDTREDGIWFEEGMAEYIGRSYFLTPEAFEEEARINRLLVELLQERYGRHSLEDFGAATYEGDFASIFFEYWRSFLAVAELVKQFGSVESVFASYQEWGKNRYIESLSEWFHI